MEKEIEPSKILMVEKKNTKKKEQIEVFQFYAYDPSINMTETLNKNNAYEFSDVFRVESQDGFKSPQNLQSDDPHVDYKVGEFYVSGYTSYVIDKDENNKDIPVFLKVPGDRAALWFNLNYEEDYDYLNYDAMNSGQDHKIFGYPFFTQDDPRSNGENDILLLQIDSDNQDIMWGDCGVGAFFISEENLKNLDFDKAFFNWDCG